jgi:hypothetical protein
MIFRAPGGCRHFIHRRPKRLRLLLRQSYQS